MSPHVNGEAFDADQALDPSKSMVPAVARVNERRVARGFWPKIRRTAARITFASDALSVWFCAKDPETPAQAKALMMGADAGAELGNGEHVATGGVFEGYGIEMKDESPSARPGLSAPLAQELVRLVKERTGRDPLAKLGWTDVARFSQLGIPAVNLGAGDPLLAHKHDEQVPESDLTAMAAILEDWLV